MHFCIICTSLNKLMLLWFYSFPSANLHILSKFRGIVLIVSSPPFSLNLHPKEHRNRRRIAIVTAARWQWSLFGCQPPSDSSSAQPPSSSLAILLLLCLILVVHLLPLIKNPFLLLESLQVHAPIKNWTHYSHSSSSPHLTHRTLMSFWRSFVSSGTRICLSATADADAGWWSSNTGCISDHSEDSLSPWKALDACVCVLNLRWCLKAAEWI